MKTRSTKTKVRATSIRSRLIAELDFLGCDVDVITRPFGRGWDVRKGGLNYCKVTRDRKGTWTLSFPQGFKKKYTKSAGGLVAMCCDIDYLMKESSDFV